MYQDCLHSWRVLENPSIPTKHVLGDGRAQNVAGELAERVLGVDAGGALEHLDHGLGAADFQHLGTTRRSERLHFLMHRRIQICGARTIRIII